MTLGRVLMAAVLLCAVVASTPARAQETVSEEDDARAQMHFRVAQSHYEARRWQDAAREFQAAFDLSQRTVLLVNVATARERALQFEEARAALEQYLALEPTTEDRAEIEARIAEYSRLAAEQNAGASATESAAPVETRGGVSGLLVAGIITDAVGGALGIVSLVTGLVAESIYSDLDEMCGPSRLCPSGTNERISEGEALALTSTITMFISAAALVTGGILLAVELTSSGQDDAEAVSVQLSPTPGGLSFRGAF